MNIDLFSDGDDTMWKSHPLMRKPCMQLSDNLAFYWDNQSFILLYEFIFMVSKVTAVRHYR